jgi:hypothetical protein
MCCARAQASTHNAHVAVHNRYRACSIRIAHVACTMRRCKCPLRLESLSHSMMLSLRAWPLLTAQIHSLLPCFDATCSSASCPLRVDLAGLCFRLCALVLCAQVCALCLLLCLCSCLVSGCVSARLELCVSVGAGVRLAVGCLHHCSKNPTGCSVTPVSPHAGGGPTGTWGLG